MDPRLQPGFLGTGASLMADFTLLAYIFLLVPGMIVGFVFARRKMFEPYHKLTMTTIMLVNWALILFLMVVSYSRAVAPEVPQGLNQAFYLLPTIHLITGGIAQIVATYLVIRMWFENVLPDWFKVKNIKRPMRFTLAMWLITAALGIGIYFTWYAADPATAQDAPPPVATAEINSPIATDDANIVVPLETVDSDDDTPEAPVETPEIVDFDALAVVRPPTRTRTPSAPAETPELDSRAARDATRTAEEAQEEAEEAAEEAAEDATRTAEEAADDDD